LARGATFPPPTSKPRARKPTFTPASKAQRAKVALTSCAVADCASVACDPAHLTPRARGGCDDPDCVVSLCRTHHRQFDDGALDLLPHLAHRGYGRELGHMMAHYEDPLSVLHRLTGQRWITQENQRA
jgi:hypothetical protein